MPALRLFGRRWMMSSDDVPILAVGPTVFHGAWCIALFVGWLVLNRPSHCHEGARYAVALAGLFFTFLLNFVLGVWLIHEGLKGSIFETKKRWKVEPLLTVDFLVFFVEIGFVIYGTVVLYQTPPYCLKVDKQLWSPNGIMNVMIWTTWAVLAVSFILLLITYNFFPDFQDERSWEHRCRLVTMICCCKCRNPEPHGQHTDDIPAAPYARLAMLFSQLFGVIDLVPSDVVASFLLVAALQRANRGAALKSVLSNALLSEEGVSAEALAHPSQQSPAATLDSETDSGDVMLPSGSRAMDVKEEEEGPQMAAKPTLFTPSGMGPQFLPKWNVEDFASRHSEHWALDAVSDHDLDETAHYCRYAFAAYGYLLYIWSQPQYKWHINQREAWGPLDGMSGLDDRDIVFVRYVNEAKDNCCLPYLIAVDKTTTSVVIAIRGTLSLEDCLTDFMCEPAALNDWIAGAPGSDNPSSFDDDTPTVQLASRGNTITAHAGILSAAKAVVQDLQETGELKGLLENRLPHPRSSGRSRPDAAHPTHDCRGWRVVVTGHSLGAGASVLVALYLRNYFRNVYCWAFSPPGGLAEPSVAEAARSFCTSVALGKDWIPRLTLGSFEHLRDEMIMAAARCKISKTAFLLGLLRGKRWDDHKLFRSPEEPALPEEPRSLISTYRKSALSNSSRDRYEVARTFILPGRLMYLRPLKAKPHEKKRKRRYDAVWAKAEDLHGEGIIVSPRMMADHMPDYVTEVLGKLARARRRSNPEAFSRAPGPAVGSGSQHVSGPARSHMAIDVDSDSDQDYEPPGDRGR